MLIKADLYNIDLYDPYVLMFLIKTTTYHHAFWPHTAKRFYAFKKVLKSLKNLPRDPKFIDILNYVSNTIDEYEHNMFRQSTPGGRQETQNLKQVMDILVNLEKNSK